MELFAGAGGMALGVHKAGFQHIGLVEWNKFAVDTLKENSKRLLSLNPEFVIHSDARKINYTSLLGKIDLLTGGPPCQPFSTGGNNGGSNDQRNMFPVMFDAIATIRPKAILIENVIGLMREKFQDYVNYILLSISFPLNKIKSDESWVSHYNRLQKVKDSSYNDDEKYNIDFQIIDTADYGIPQRRVRVLFTAFRKDLSIESFKLTPTHSKEALLIDQWITGDYWKRHNTKPIDYFGKRDGQIIANLKNNSEKHINELPWVTVRDALHDLPKPVTRGREEIIPNHVQHPGARVYQGHVGSYYDYPAKALKAGTHGTPGGENMLIIPATGEVRYFTTREAARLHTFPDEYKFHGTWGACIKQLGNAVPVDVINLFSAQIKKRLT